MRIVLDFNEEAQKYLLVVSGSSLCGTTENNSDEASSPVFIIIIITDRQYLTLSSSVHDQVGKLEHPYNVPVPVLYDVTVPTFKF